MPSNVVVIGSYMGRSLVAGMLADKLGLKRRATGDIPDEEYQAIGYDEKIANEIWEKDSFAGEYEYVTAFRAQLVQKMLADPGSDLLNLESGCSVYEDPTLLEQVQTFLKPFENVVFLTPAPDPDEASQIVGKSLRRWFESWFEVGDFFVDSHCNAELAKITLYTQNKTPEESCEELITKLSSDQPDDVMLIGPMNTGKSTLGGLLSKKLNRPSLSLDVLRDKYQKELGYDPNITDRIRITQTAWELFRYWQTFHPHTVERTLEEHPNQHSIIDFGGGHSVFDDPTLFEQVKTALAPYKNVVLILPSPDKEKSKAILRSRNAGMYDNLISLEERLARHSSNQSLAKITVYTDGKTPEQICDEVLAKLSTHAK